MALSSRNTRERNVNGEGAVDTGIAFPYALTIEATAQALLAKRRKIN
jgi:hypothetical protein